MPAITDIKKKAADINPSTKTGITKGCHDPLPVKGVLGYWWVVGAMQRYCVPRTDLGQRVKKNKKKPVLPASKNSNPFQFQTFNSGHGTVNPRLRCLV